MLVLYHYKQERTEKNEVSLSQRSTIPRFDKTVKVEGK